LNSSGAVEPGAIEITLCCILRRGNKVQPSTGGIDSNSSKNVSIEPRDETLSRSILPNSKNMTPAIFFGGPEEFRIIDPLHIPVRHIHPCLVLIVISRLHNAGLCVGEQNVIRVLKPIQPLNHQRC